MNEQRLCRICLSIEESREHLPIFGNEHNIAHNIYLCSGVQITEFDTESSPALICEPCMKDLEKALHFRNNAIKGEKYFKQSVSWIENEEKVKEFEPEVTIKLEDGEGVRLVKSEPFFSNPKYEFIDSMTSVPGTELALEGSSFIDTRFNFDYEENLRWKKKSQVGYEEFGSSSGVVRCNLCLKSFTSVNSHSNHMKTVHREMSESEMFKCRYCNRLYKLKIYLNRHITRVHQIKDRSNKSRCESKKRISHESIFNKEDISLYCELCKQFFTTRGSLQKHVRVKHEFVDMKDRFVCDHCGSTFLIKYYLIRHIRVRHLRNFIEKKTPDQPTPCEVCGKILKNRGLLKPHMRSHKVMTAEDYWYCDLCPRKFKTKGGCTWHIQQRHILKATFPCKLCPGVVYKGKWELKCHIKSKHTNIRDYKCEICGKGFMDRQKLQIHTRIHTGERPHVCHICPQTFIHQTDLRRHIWGHTGERPYKCSHSNCGKGFMKRSELMNHENRCHPPVQQQQQLPYQQHYAM